MRGEEDDQRSDADLLAAIVQRDRTAVEVLHCRYAAWLTVLLSHRTRDSAIVEDVVQMTFMAVLEKPDKWRAEGHVAAWIRSIATHKLLDQQHPRSKISAAIRLVPDVVVDGWRYAEPSAEEEYLRSRDVPCSEIGDALNKLSPKRLEVARRCWLDGLTISEAARALGIPPGTVKTRLMHARNQLREELGATVGREPEQAVETPGQTGGTPRKPGETPKRTGEAPERTGETPEKAVEAPERTIETKRPRVKRAVGRQPREELA